MQDVRLSDLKAGDTITVDADFTCMEAGEKIVHSDEGRLFVSCSAGAHFLDGQLREDGTLSGVETVCSACGKPVGNGAALCGRDDGIWCGRCFPETACGRGEHGEGCQSLVFEGEA